MDGRDQDQGGRCALPLSDAVVPGRRARRNGRSSGKDWNKFASEPSGTGPFKLARLVPRERAELVKNEGYWNPKRIPKTDRLVLICAPEDSSRTAALLSDSVDMIETPPPDAVARLKQGGMRIEQNVTPHVWNYHPSLLPRLAVDRHPAAQGRQPRDRPRRDRQAAERAGQAGARPGRPDQPVVRQAHLRAQVRARRGAQADERGGLQQGQAAEDQVRRWQAAAPARCCRCP